MPTKKPMPGDTVTFHMCKSLDPEEPIEDIPAKVLGAAFLIDRELPILTLEVEHNGVIETLHSVSSVRTHPELAELGDADLAAHTARRGYWS